MKSAAKIIKSLHTDSETLSAMFLGYFVLLAVSASIIFGSVEQTNETVASKDAAPTHAQIH